MPKIIYNILRNTGLIIGEKRYIVQIRSVICDNPARAFVTYVKSHNGYFGCGKCMQEGTYSNHHMLFLESTAPLRTDQNFKNRIQEDHHTSVSPFESIQLPMVSRFPLDYVHLICLGVTKKIVAIVVKWISDIAIKWTKNSRVIGNVNYYVRMSTEGVCSKTTFSR